ncbi:MAG: monovalent cation/H(+) antiporter subunit G [Rhodospirillales bacterium]|jgi:multicomponent Na+:H+ antiporter subunit G|nr:monovalent cation/H(+) antiporter subunit G [Rhodospirillales bacterium]MBT5076114.1 monovalent cation/H(+) antiporter subunit G [Rhodospirillales bacterium]MBT5112908.1 monovalent cation/H(+) antiporter subunit G [Rhodospirillales bacterium]MBT5673679.1 monovalent cation/H(+) antiporter subunit G [Rhodospirillales bacterium]MBT6186337.1 monovalent cation/H(+) antiporter subunit G [Rhodospirillales bacterium]
MIQLIIDSFSWALLMGGAFFVLIGATGLIRLPDFYTRMHGAGITDTLGADLILLGLMLQAGFTLVTVKLFLIGAFLLITSPSSSHAIANAAFTAGLNPQVAPDDGPDGDGS